MSFKNLAPQTDNKQRLSVLNQLVDIIQEDVSSSDTRRSYQVFVTGGLGPGVTSSLFQTIYDQNYTLQTANPMFDMTVGLYVSSSTVLGATSSVGQDASGKLLFPSQTLMMREKVNIYRQYAATLLGNASSPFYAPYGSSTSTDRIDNAMFISFKRLFVRDGIKRETFAMRMFRSASAGEPNQDGATGLPAGKQNLKVTSISGSTIFTDIGASANQLSVFGGEVGSIVNASNTGETVGLLFYDAGTAVFDMSKVFSGSQRISGTIDAVNASGQTMHGEGLVRSAKFIPDFLVSASIDDIVDHIASTRFQSGTLTAATFQNNTQINSSIFFCRVGPDEFNFSTNPTFIDGSGRIRVIDQGSNTQRSFTMITTIGLHDDKGDLMAVAKLSRPIEKNDEKDVTFRIRLDF